MRRGTSLGAALAAVILAVPGAATAARVKHAKRADGDAAIGFSTPTIVDPLSTFGEPSIGVDPVNGDVFASGPGGTGVQRSQWEASNDGGQSFRIMNPILPPSGLTSTEDAPGGGDTDLNFDRAGKQYFADLFALSCLRTATSTDTGDQVQTNPDGCSTYPAADRQWLAVYDPPPGTPHDSAYVGPTPLVYLEYNALVAGAQWNKSNDGLSYTPALAGETPQTRTKYLPFGADGYPAIDQQTGKIFQAAGMSAGGVNDLVLNIGTPDAQGNLTFLDAPTTSGGSRNSGALIHIANNLAASPDTLFTVLSMDSARNLFIVYTISGNEPSQWQTYVSAASAASGWKKWTAPVQVSDGSGATGDAVNVFPWIKAGGPGRADAVWYGSDKSADPSSDSDQSWNVFMSQLVFPVDGDGAITGAPPRTTLVKVSPHPMHYQDICQNGTGCVEVQGNRNLADFFTLTIDQDGAAQIIYPDTSNNLAQAALQPTGNQTLDHSGAPLVTIAHQTAGMGLYGKRIDGSSNAPTPGISDPSGDATYPVIDGSEVPGMDLLGTSLKLDANAKTLTITNKVLDLSNPVNTVSEVPGSALLQYVTRWQMGNTIYYAAMSNTAANQPLFYAGQAQSVDLCSVSACEPHLLTYPEANVGGTAETGNVSCPPTPSLETPCTITITVNTADVGNPTASSLLEEVGTYAFSASHPQGQTTTAQAQANHIPLEIDGSCCFNYSVSPNPATSYPVPPPGTPLPSLPAGAFRHADPSREPAVLTW